MTWAHGGHRTVSPQSAQDLTVELTLKDYHFHGNSKDRFPTTKISGLQRCNAKEDPTKSEVKPFLRLPSQSATPLLVRPLLGSMGCQLTYQLLQPRTAGWEV